MKKVILTFLTLIPLLTLAQNKKFELGISVGNNGMFREVQQDMYDYVFSLYNYETYEIKSSELKYTLSARYFFSENVSGRLKLGYAKVHDEYEGSSTVYSAENIEINQNITNFTPSICFSKKLDKFEIMTALELPLIFVGDIEADYELDDDFAPAPASAKETITGGKIWGISGGIGVRYNFSNVVAVGTEINYGLLFANVGDEIESEFSDGVFTESYSIEGEFKKTYFSSPEISLGLYFNIGGGKHVAPETK